MNYPMAKFFVGQVVCLNENTYHRIAYRRYGRHPIHIAEKRGWFYELDGWGGGIQAERFLRELSPAEVGR